MLDRYKLGMASPSEHNHRWTPTRKLALLNAIDCGEISAAEACTLHSISDEELAGWRQAASFGGAAALRARSQSMRDKSRLQRFAPA